MNPIGRLNAATIDNVQWPPVGVQVVEAIKREGVLGTVPGVR